MDASPPADPADPADPAGGRRAAVRAQLAAVRAAGAQLGAWGRRPPDGRRDRPPPVRRESLGRRRGRLTAELARRAGPPPRAGAQAGEGAPGGPFARCATGWGAAPP